ncbi:MAG: hypothetical protein VXZ53_12320, partial [Planctomycetota bacterium]|nr:hypothetical protein [Planctomycetota bacterium]
PRLNAEKFNHVADSWRVDFPEPLNEFHTHRSLSSLTVRGASRRTLGSALAVFQPRIDWAHPHFHKPMFVVD